MQGKSNGEALLWQLWHGCADLPGEAGLADPSVCRDNYPNGVICCAAGYGAAAARCGIAAAGCGIVPAISSAVADGRGVAAAGHGLPLAGRGGGAHDQDSDATVTYKQIFHVLSLSSF